MSARISVLRTPAGNGGEDDSPKGFALQAHLKEWRKHRRLTVAELATKVNKSVSLVAQWESGSRIMSMADLQQLARVYGVPPSALLGSPADATRGDLREAAGEIIRDMDAESALQWLQLGRKLPRSKG
jgi:transcriptional regulator with XRE-family HTH domain